MFKFMPLKAGFQFLNDITFKGLPRLLGVAIIIIALMPADSYAFKPKSDSGHAGLTTNGLETISYTDSNGTELKFTEKAIKEVVDANASVDAWGGFNDSVNHCDDEEIIACTARIRDLATRTKDAVSGEAKDGTRARELLGQALHTLQDFYSHSNWVNSPGPSNSGHFAGMGTTTLPELADDQQTCFDDFYDNVLMGEGLTNITTGYFGSTPANKCAHGIVPGVGIHKDWDGRPFYTGAFASAGSGTTAFVNLVKDSLGRDDAAIRALFGLGSSIGFVIDDTGSMGTEIDGVKTTVSDMISAAAEEEKPPSSYVLVVYGDPDVGSPLVTSDPADILSAVNSISPYGGGDCPELAQAGLLRGIGASQSDGKLYLLTDATSKDSDLASNVIEAATQKKVVINYLLTGSCSPIDPAYLKVARDTGGQAFIISPYETSKFIGLIKPTLSGDLESILIANGTFASTSEDFTFPVDAGISHLTISITGGTGIITLPDGSLLNTDDPNVTLTTLSSGQIINIDSPANGNWALSVTGAGTYSVSVLGNTQTAFSNFEFVKEGGRDAHTGYFPIKGQPITGTNVIGAAQLSQVVNSVEFQMRSLSGDVLGTIPLIENAYEGDLPKGVFAGEFVMPEMPFRIYAHGTTGIGDEFLRAYPRTLIGQTLGITVKSDDYAEIGVGQTMSLSFDVTNFGSYAYFRMTVADELGYAGGVSPYIALIGSGKTVSVTASVSIPDSATEGLDTVTFAATNTANPDATNTASLQLKIIVTDDADGDGIANHLDSCPNSDMSEILVIQGCDTGAKNVIAESGCTLSDLVMEAAKADIHGDFVSSVTHLADDAKSLKLISGSDYGRIVSCAAK